jgi:hypothetical protein
VGVEGGGGGVWCIGQMSRLVTSGKFGCWSPWCPAFWPTCTAGKTVLLVRMEGGHSGGGVSVLDYGGIKSGAAGAKHPGHPGPQLCQGPKGLRVGHCGRSREASHSSFNAPHPSLGALI